MTRARVALLEPSCRVPVRAWQRTEPFGAARISAHVLLKLGEGDVQGKLAHTTERGPSPSHGVDHEGTRGAGLTFLDFFRKV